MSRITSLSAILSNRLIEHHVRGAIPAGRFQAVANIPLRGKRQPLSRDCRARDGAAQTLSLLAFVCFARDPGV